jgi:hypothetical protein
MTIQRHKDFARLEREYGITLPRETVDYLPELYAQDCELAFDAQPTLVTTSSAGVPAYLTNYVDPDLIRVLVTPNQAAEIVGEVRKGDWLTETATFPVVENTGETSAYGDFNDNGSVGANVNFPQRQSFHYQTVTRWGEKTLERMGLAKIGWAAQLNVASALILDKMQNRMYFNGIAGLQNYGILNEPSLAASIQPGPKAYNSQAHGPWVTSGVITATANEIYTDVQSLYYQLVKQGGGTIKRTDKFTLAMSPESEMAMTATNSFNVSVLDLLKKSFPGLEIKTAPEYNTTAGEVVQLILDKVEGQDVCYCAFTEKMRAHNIVQELSAWKQKKSQGGWGFILRVPYAIASMIGV